MTEYDLIIIGGGCAGYPAAVYALRYNLKVLVIVKENGGLIATTTEVQNYPGFISINGSELANKFEEQAKANGAEILNDIVTSVEKIDNKFIVKTDFKKKEFIAKTVLFATGTVHRKLNIPSEIKLRGRGVSYCATCDGLFFRNKIVGVIGGGDSAVKDAIILAQTSKKVYIFVRSHLKAEPKNVEQLKKLSNIEIIEGVNVKEVLGDKFVTGVMLDNEKQIELNGLFIAIGLIPQSELVKPLGVELTSIGEIKIDKNSKTNISGIYAAGDVTDFGWKQAIVASSQGCTAAHSAFKYIGENFK